MKYMFQHQVKFFFHFKYVYSYCDVCERTVPEDQEVGELYKVCFGSYPIDCHAACVDHVLGVRKRKIRSVGLKRAGKQRELGVVSLEGNERPVAEYDLSAHG